MVKFKFVISSDSKVVDANGVIKQNGFSNFKLVPVNSGKGFKATFNEHFDDRIDPVVIELGKINAEATNIKNRVLELSTNLTTNYLSEAELFDPDTIGLITSSIEEHTATFVTTKEAGQWYGLELTTDVNGKKYITGFDIGAIVTPESNHSDSYFRINADRFIVGSDLGDGSFSTAVGPDGEPIPAFSIVQNESGPPQMYFNGRVNMSAIPTSVTKMIGNFASLTDLNLYLQDNPDIKLNPGDSYKNTTEKVMYFWDGVEWISADGKLELKSFVFKRSKNKPTAPTGGSYLNSIPAGWNDGIPAPTFISGADYSNTAVDPVWVSYALFDNKTNYTSNPVKWSDPEIMADTPNNDVMFHNSDTKPPNPTYSGDILLVSATDAANGWYNIASVNAVWTANRRKNAGEWTPWQVYRVKGEKGEKGADGRSGANGANGSRGSSILHGSGYGSFSASDAYSAFISKFGNVINGDQYIWTSTDYGTVIRTYNGSTWIDNTALTVHGDAVINGTIYANKLATDAIRSKTATFDNSTGTVTGYNSGSTWAVAVTGGPSATGGLSAQGYTHGLGGYTRGSGDGAAGVYGLSDNIWGGTGTGIGVLGVSYYNKGVYGISNTGVGVYARGGSWGIYTPNAIYAANFSPFTGSHIAYTKNNPVVGDIYCSDDAWVIDVSQTLVHASISNKDKDTTVFGVVRSIDDVMTNITENELLSIEDDGEWSVRPEYQPYVTHLQENGFVEIMVNSLGEGGINVCAVNGNILNGDYITSSIVAGKGMKQDDDLMHNYTVAKALEDVIWDDEIVGEGGCFEQDGCKCKMIACTYHSG